MFIFRKSYKMFDKLSIKFKVFWGYLSLSVLVVSFLSFFIHDNDFLKYFLINIAVALLTSLVLGLVLEYLTQNPEDSFVIDQARNHTRNLKGLIDKRTAQIRALQEQLIDQAYAQGRAENAINILHNLGNLITPAMARISSDDDLENFELVTQVIAGVSHQLKGLASEDLDREKIHFLLDTLDELQREVKKNVDSLRENKTKVKGMIEKMSRVISLQQKYAHFGEKKVQRVLLHEVVEDVLAMYESDLSHRGIQIVKDFQSTPFVKVEKNRFSNVIVNFLTNAIEAIENQKSPREGKRIHITILQKKEVRLIFEDSGTGFDRQTAGKIFHRGFSTKADPSGFGLHNCANLVASYGGTLEISSPGSGLGAKVLLSLPA